MAIRSSENPRQKYNEILDYIRREGVIISTDDDPKSNDIKSKARGLVGGGIILVSVKRNFKDIVVEVDRL